MKLFRVSGIQIKVNPLFLVMLIFTAFTGYLTECMIIVGVVLSHEIAHVLAARWRRVEVLSLEMLPFGAAARLSDAPMKVGDELFTALAGPGINLLTVMAAFSLERAFPSLELPDMLTQYALTLALFNLLPALPLDGGRALRALLTPLAGRTRATRIACGMGYGLSVVMIGFGIFMLLYEGWFNLTLFVIGAFIFLCAYRERKTLSYQMLHDIMRKSDRLSQEKTLPIRQIAVYYNMPANRLLRARAPGVVNVFTVVDEHLRVLGQIAEGDLMSLADSTASLSEVLEHR